MYRFDNTKQINTWMLIIPFKGILVNKLLATRLVMKCSEQQLETLSTNENESCIENSLEYTASDTDFANVWKTSSGAKSVRL